MSKKIRAAIAVGIAMLLWSSTVKAEFYWTDRHGITAEVKLDCANIKNQIAHTRLLEEAIKIIQIECINTNPVDKPECLTTVHTLSRVWNIRKGLAQVYQSECSEA
ncbi:MAG: hypothetical protein ACE5KG_02110, partial [Nitrososphaerales archaeon]